ncbi:hypothetical protein FDECE_17354 [Fusarium decemcellulare]|nr:hypothetical protein FDECE_17354 [Fusarium decemcellulare]
MTKLTHHPSLLIPLTILAGLSALAVDALHLDLDRIGFTGMSAPLIDPDNTRMRKNFTGLEVVDGLLTTLIIMFQPIFTGEMPELSLFAFYFAGTEERDEVEHYEIAHFIVNSATLWAIIMQVVGYGIVMPIYYILDLLFSSTDMTLASPDTLYAIIPAFVLGFFVPSALQTLPTSRDVHQIFLAFWQAFPIHVGFLLWAFSYIVKPAQPSNLPGKKASLDKQAISHAYGFAVTIGAITHWATIALILCVTAAPEVFPSGVAEHLSFSSVFIPTPLHWSGPATITSATMHFLQTSYYGDNLNFQMPFGTKGLLKLWDFYP